MPCMGITGNYTEFKETLDQLSVTLSQYAPTHKIIIGGDLNEDITLTANGARAKYLREFIEEHELKTSPRSQFLLTQLERKYLPLTIFFTAILCRAGRYYRDTGISQHFISVIRIVIQFGRIAIFSSLFIVTISCWNLS